MTVKSADYFSPPPGHPVAEGMGCLCNQKQNNFGHGAGVNDSGTPLFVVNPDCEMHQDAVLSVIEDIENPIGTCE